MTEKSIAEQIKEATGWSIAYVGGSDERPRPPVTEEKDED